MPLGQLVKITAARKLMVRIDQDTFDKLRDRQIVELKRNKIPVDRLATFELENDEGDENQFVMISLDKYDKQLLERKFEPLLKKHIIFQCRTKCYDFIPEGQNEQLRGINLELTSIRLNKLQKTAEQFSSPVQKKIVESDSDEDDEHVNDPVIQLVAELERQEMAGTLPPAPAKKLTLIEQMMRDMEARDEERAAETEVLPEGPPELLRQTGTTELQPTEPKRRRRVTLPVA